MKHLFLLLVISHSLTGLADVVTIPDDRYSFNVTHVTANILAPEIKPTESMADCLLKNEVKGLSITEAHKDCKKLLRGDL